MRQYRLIILHPKNQKRHNQAQSQPTNVNIFAGKWKGKYAYSYHYRGHPIFATVLSMPVLLAFVLLIPHWYQTEKTLERRLMTLHLLLLQLWPQYRVLKLLILLFKDREEQQKYHEKKAEHDKNITCLGKSITVHLHVHIAWFTDTCFVLTGLISVAQKIECRTNCCHQSAQSTQY